MRRIAMLGALGAWMLATGAAAADKAQIADWWRAYEVAPFAKTPDGRKLRYFCQGEGGPPVVLESGLGSGAWAWRTVQPDLAKTTRVCSYDRAGYGLSDEAKDRRDIESIAADLAVVVKAVGRGKPVVLVGHSLGGPIVRQFSYRHPKLVAGVVLLDPSFDHQTKRFAETVPQFAKISATAYDPVRQCLSLLEKGPIAEGAPEYARCVGPVPPDMPPELAHFHVSYGQSPVHFRAQLAELGNALSEESGAEADAARRPLGDVPFIVLSAGKPTTAPGFSAEDSARATELWRRQHWEMTVLSSQGRRRFVEGSGHGIQLDRPDAVIQAVNEVVAEVRGR